MATSIDTRLNRDNLKHGQSWLLPPTIIGLPDSFLRGLGGFARVGWGLGGFT